MSNIQANEGIDFGRGNISTLFRKMFYPTLTGMIFMVLFTITDGIFVGHGIGSDALAAVNIVAPLFMLSTGNGLMFGAGAAVMASICLSRGKLKMARINVSQAVAFSSAIMLVCTVLIFVFDEKVLYLLGCSDTLMPLAQKYLWGITPFFIINTLLCSCGFFIRLSGAPKYAMTCSVISAVLNIILDYLFIFPFGMGIFGAAIATGVGSTAGAAMMLVYLSRRSNELHFVKLKMTYRSVKSAMRDISYMSRLGVSSFLNEISSACMMLCGNYVFMRLMGKDGVAAFSITCYFFPIVYILYNSIVASMQPVISYNHGCGNTSRVHESMLVMLKTAFVFGIVLTLGTIFLPSAIATMFISPLSPVHDIATHGLPYFAAGFLPFAANIVAIGYFQSVERMKIATTVTLLRGFVWLVICFLVLPQFLDVVGAWFAVPAAELLTLLFVVPKYLQARKHTKR